MSEVIISPSILSANFANLEKDIKLVEKAGAEWLHIDVMDGHFVPNLTIGVPVVKSVRKVTNLLLDVHLMIEDPQKYVKPFVDAGADIITFHYEAVGDKSTDLISYIKSFGVMAGISIKPETTADAVSKYVPLADLVLVMTVEPGFGGQKFMPDCAEKLSYIKSLQKQGQYLQVDGGINDKTALICKNKGANSLVAGSYIFGADDFTKMIASLR